MGSDYVTNCLSFGNFKRRMHTCGGALFPFAPSASPAYTPARSMSSADGLSDGVIQEASYAAVYSYTLHTLFPTFVLETVVFGACGSMTLHITGSLNARLGMSTTAIALLVYMALYVVCSGSSV